AQADRRGGVAGHGLGDDVGGGKLGNRRAHGGRLIGRGDDQRVLQAHQRPSAAHGGGDQRFGSAERQQLLGPRAAAGGPEARPGATTDYHGDRSRFLRGHDQRTLTDRDARGIPARRDPSRPRAKR